MLVYHPMMRLMTMNMNNLEKIGENLYSFKICLADARVDSDYERFTISALDKMADLFRGRTGFMAVQSCTS